MEKRLRKRSQKKYLIGFVGQEQVIYGRMKKGEQVMWVEKMTLQEATRSLKKLFRTGRTKVSVFELVPVK